MTANAKIANAHFPITGSWSDVGNKSTIKSATKLKINHKGLNVVPSFFFEDVAIHGAPFVEIFNLIVTRKRFKKIYVF